LVIARHRRCRFPGCRQPAERCQLDHVIPYPKGPTALGNLGPLSARCHRAKTEAGWHPEHDPDTGTYTWTSPTGHPYTDQIEPPPGPHPGGQQTDQNPGEGTDPPDEDPPDGSDPPDRSGPPDGSDPPD